jgi:KDO2-lipid IV(A) lauroyltransferase
MDQAVTGNDGVFVDFFGEKAGSSKAMAILACRSGAAVLPVHIVREDDDITHRVIIGHPVEVTITEDRAQDIVDNTQRFQQVLEGIIRQYPEQWFWMHRRWKNSPSLGPGREGYPPK